MPKSQNKELKSMENNDVDFTTGCGKRFLIENINSSKIRLHNKICKICKTRKYTRNTLNTFVRGYNNGQLINTKLISKNTKIIIT